VRRLPAVRVPAAFLAANRRLTIAVLVVAVASGLLVPVFALATGALVRSLRSGGGVTAALVVVSVVFVLGRLLDPAREQLGESLWRQSDEWLSRRVMVGMSAPVGVAHVESPEVRDRLAQTEGLVTGVTPGEAGWWLGPVVLLWVQGIVSLAIVAAYRWWAAVALIAGYAVSYRVSRYHWHHVTLVLMGRTPRLRHSYYVRALALTPEVAKETRVFGLADWLVERYRQGWLAEMQEIWRTRSEGWLATFSASVAVGAVELAVVGALVRAALDGDLSLAAAVTVVQAVLGAAVLSRYEDGNWFLSEFARVLDDVESIEAAGAEDGGITAVGTRSADGLPARSIRFENVTFAYPGSDRPVFSGLDLEIAAGQSLAIVGENGAGKTTLIKLLTRLYDPQEGRVTVDGIDLRELDPRSWHRRVGAVFQDYVRFEVPAYDNVAYGNLARRDDRARVLEAAALSGADRAIEQLPDGWSTVLTREVTGGAELSGGEWQRLALARALFAVRTGAGLLILDEPTASLDVRGEAQVYARFLELTRGVTTIVVSHRFSTVRRADRIVVVEHGHVLEDGSHGELLAADGRYATMYRLQAEKFGA
jgi:ABC-type multidrug transport system fused ATPase/permease subunit